MSVAHPEPQPSVARVRLHKTEVGFPSPAPQRVAKVEVEIFVGPTALPSFHLQEIQVSW